MEHFDLTLFDLSPIAMWLQDFSGVKKIFTRWANEGVTDFEAYLLEDLTRLWQCLETITTQRVNDSTLKLYEAKDVAELNECFVRFLTPEVTHAQIKFFCALWRGDLKYRVTIVNYTCTGKAIDIQLSGNVVTGYEDTWGQLLMTTENVSDFQNARRLAESLFMHSPTALWTKDYSGIKKRFELLKNNGVTDLEQYIKINPNFVEDCFNQITSRSVNQSFLDLFAAKDQAEFDRQSCRIICLNKQKNFYRQLLAMWSGQQALQQDGEYESLDGDRLFLLEKFTIFPAAQENWETVQIAYTDLTERKKLEEHLHHLSLYDQLTQLYNRTFFNEELTRLEQEKIYPVSCIYIDINGLKPINDLQGHYYGDLHLQNFARIAKQVIKNKPWSISRVGGDEFVVLMPFAREADAKKLIRDIEYAISQDKLSPNKISFSSGVATMEQHQTIESLITKADQNMYDTKKNYYRMRSV